MSKQLNQTVQLGIAPWQLLRVQQSEVDENLTLQEIVSYSFELAAALPLLIF